MGCATLQKDGTTTATKALQAFSSGNPDITSRHFSSPRNTGRQSNAAAVPSLSLADSSINTSCNGTTTSG
jgi:hypothetical protein